MKGAKRELKFEENTTGEIPSSHSYNIVSGLEQKINSHMGRVLGPSHERLKKVASTNQQFRSGNRKRKCLSASLSSILVQDLIRRAIGKPRKARIHLGRFYFKDTHYRVEE